MEQIYRENRAFFLQRDTVIFLLFLFLCACTYKAFHINSLGMGYEVTLYYINAWVLFSRHRIERINYLAFGFIAPFTVSLSLILLAVIFR